MTDLNHSLNPRKSRRIHWILLGLILFSALFLRVYRLDTLPDGFFCDEASLGYNAWAILHYGIDETGVEMPLYATSLGVHKNPVFVYSSMIPIGLLDLSEFSVRLSSAIYGWLTILALFWLMYEIHGITAGLLAAFFLSILPWNFHFSRIGFELITWPCLFTFGLASFIRGCRRGGWIWLLSGFCFGLALHSYVMAMAFLPLFLPFLCLIYLKNFRKNIKWVAGASMIFLLLVIPAVTHHLDTRDTLHFRSVNWWAQSENEPLSQRLDTLWNHYKPFFGEEFLVTQGDPNPRHNLANHGPLLKSLFYLTLAGIILAIFPFKRTTWILLLWTLLYPLGTALTIDRFATRSIIGSPLAPAWSALGISIIWQWITHIKTRWWKIILHSTILIPVLLFPSHDAIKYFKRYISEYNTQSACGIYGFQCGYEELIEFMEPLRSEYDQFLWTAHNVNEPYIFSLFYNKLNPEKFIQDHDIGYTITRSFEFSNYSIEPRTLFALRPDELMYFDDYTVLHEVMSYSGLVEFVIIEPHSRRSYLDQWSLRGIWRQNNPVACSNDYPDPSLDYGIQVKTLSGKSHWLTVQSKPPLVDIQGMFIHADPKNPNNPEFVECIGATWLYFDEPGEYQFEVFGSHDTAAFWLNGQQIMAQKQLQLAEIHSGQFNAVSGWNEVSFRSCEGIGDWFFIFSLRDKSGHGFTPRLMRTAPPGLDLYPLPEDEMPSEGYRGVP